MAELISFEAYVNLRNRIWKYRSSDCGLEAKLPRSGRNDVDAIALFRDANLMLRPVSRHIRRTA